MDGFTPRKQMAMGGSMPNIPSTRGNKDNDFSQSSGPTFGVSPVLGGGPGPVNNMDRNAGTAPHMPDHMRSAKPPIPGGKMRHRNQANPDHGPHHINVGQMRRLTKTSYSSGGGGENNSGW